MRIYPLIKNVADRSIAFLLLLILVPFLAYVAVMVQLNLGKPVFFYQYRIGFKSQPFLLVKFRTMSPAVGGSGSPSSDRQRLSGFGYWLRSTSIDELPSLINIIRGQMSFIGPRPLLPQYLPLYSTHQARRHEVMPGLSGWAQVNGRNTISWEQKFLYDVWYVDHQSFSLDLRILLSTILKVLYREGINATGETSMDPFTGTSVKK